ncbi:hypothetical protein ACVWZK_001474 [Bradyrhizobium sp. GM0.4]
MSVILVDRHDLDTSSQPTKEKKPQNTPREGKRKFAPATDVCLWLTSNAPLSFEELIDIRYCLYHRCSRAGYKVGSRREDEFELQGRHGRLQVVSDSARRFLLGKLREIAKEKGWQGALPRSKSRNKCATY